MSTQATAPRRIDPAEIVRATEPLCQLIGPTGHEGQVRVYLEQSWSQLGLTPRADEVGNLLARVGGDGPRVLVMAHMDEVGFHVRHVSDDGFLFFDTAQGARRDTPERRFMLGQRAQVLSREEVVARGAFASPSGHLVPPERVQQPMTYSDFFVDVGAESRREVEAAGVHIGSPIVWDAPTALLGNRLMSRALDDRLLLATIQLLLERLDRERLGCELWVGATVQEEQGFHGARAMAANERFDAVLALDVGLAGDIPVLDATEVDTRLGRGPVVVHQDFLVTYDQSLAWSVVEAGRERGIAVQHGIFTNYATDGLAFLDTGSPAVALGPPVRYPHTACEVADVRDIADTVGLLEAFLTDKRIK